MCETFYLDTGVCLCVYVSRFICVRGGINSENAFV